MKTFEQVALATVCLGMLCIGVYFDKPSVIGCAIGYYMGLIMDLVSRVGARAGLNIRHRLRTGELDLQRVKLAAYLGSQDAQMALDIPAKVMTPGGVSAFGRWLTVKVSLLITKSTTWMAREDHAAVQHWLDTGSKTLAKNVLTAYGMWINNSSMNPTLSWLVCLADNRWQKDAPFRLYYILKNGDLQLAIDWLLS